jgi:hypothetical protein
MIGISVCAPMLGLTIIEFSFLEYPISIWVVVIGLELLSLACSGLGLGSGYVHQLCLCHPAIVMVIFILLLWIIGFGVTGLKLVGVMSAVQDCYLVRC